MTIDLAWTDVNIALPNKHYIRHIKDIEEDGDPQTPGKRYEKRNVDGRL